jgi:replicative DNA helicase
MRKIFKAIAAVVAEGKLPAIEFVADRLKGIIDSPAYTLAQIVSTEPIAASIEHYCELLTSYMIKRSLIEKSYAVIKKATSGASAQDVLDYMSAALQETEAATRPEAIQLGALVGDCIESLEAAQKAAGQITGVTTGLNEIDDITLGLQPSDLAILAGRPSMGKTALAMNIVQNSARASNTAALIFSLEMSRQQLALRVITSEARVSTRSAVKGLLMRPDWQKIMTGAGRVHDWNVFVDDRTDTLGGIRRAARSFKRRQRLELLVIDYLQLIHMPGRNNRAIEMGDVTRGLKKLAKELDVPVLVLSQLNRSLENRQEKRPMLSDLRDSGAIEQDADLVMLLYRDKFYNPKASNAAELNIAKQRNGPTGIVRLTWLDKYTRFENYSNGGER